MSFDSGIELVNPRTGFIKSPDKVARLQTVDRESDDGRRALSVIGFIGSVFSPWYRWSGRRDPENHVCLNVATYGPGGRFTMTDRGRAALMRVVIQRVRRAEDDATIAVDHHGPQVVGRARRYPVLVPGEVVDAVRPALRHHRTIAQER